ncbi:hypothetical protein BV25DRAFT_1840269 [Artomyces pyxidatus]|uniref:Uncharacterized protein n=1 Tax=Artomyces pyxidatus TaxID=48021 RepID=A0ACB8ST10_9AGAM|nr:hypothetical protein BV25DRAFT_1840269 [Artomyces pyxidatus]
MATIWRSTYARATSPTWRSKLQEKQLQGYLRWCSSLGCLGVPVPSRTQPLAARRVELATCPQGSSGSIAAHQLHWAAAAQAQARMRMHKHKTTAVTLRSRALNKQSDQTSGAVASLATDGRDNKAAKSALPPSLRRGSEHPAAILTLAAESSAQNNPLGVLFKPAYIGSLMRSQEMHSKSEADIALVYLACQFAREDSPRVHGLAHMMALDANAAQCPTDFKLSDARDTRPGRLSRLELPRSQQPRIPKDWLALTPPRPSHARHAPARASCIHTPVGLSPLRGDRRLRTLHARARVHTLNRLRVGEGFRRPSQRPMTAACLRCRCTLYLHIGAQLRRSDACYEAVARGPEQPMSTNHSPAARPQFPIPNLYYINLSRLLLEALSANPITSNTRGFLVGDGKASHDRLPSPTRRRPQHLIHLHSHHILNAVFKMSVQDQDHQAPYGFFSFASTAGAGATTNIEPAAPGSTRSNTAHRTRRDHHRTSASGSAATAGSRRTGRQWAEIDARTWWMRFGTLMGKAEVMQREKEALLLQIRRLERHIDYLRVGWLESERYNVRLEKGMLAWHLTIQDVLNAADRYDAEQLMEGIDMGEADDADGEGPDELDSEILMPAAGSD